MGNTAEGVLKNDYLYNDKELFDDGDVNWYDYGFRNYDPQIARFPQLDPLTDYYPMLTPYQYAGNDPIANVDLDGLEPLGAIGGIAQGVSDFTYAYKAAAPVFAPVTQAVTAASRSFTVLNIVTTVTNAVAAGANVASDIIKGNNITRQVGTQQQASRLGLSSSGGSEGGVDDSWTFYKSDLITYTQSKGISPTENNLGEQFENIFEEYLTSSFPVQTKAMNFRRAGKVWTEGTGRNSKPDFISDDFYDQVADCWICPERIKRVSEGSGYEVKQNNRRGIYLSSNDAQIKGHIDNLAAKHSADIATGNYNPSLTLITTYDVSWSPSITRYAGSRNVQYTHRRAMYKMVNGKYQFKFVGFGLSSL